MNIGVAHDRGCVARLGPVAMLFFASGCTVIHVVGEHGTIQTSYWPGLAYIQIEADPVPLYLHQDTFGLAISSNAWVVGYDRSEFVVVRREDLASCLLLSIADASPSRDFSFQMKDPDHVCKPFMDVRDTPRR
jgi:hypothetical protein